MVRADGSGTSAMFSDYLRQLQPAAWATFCSDVPDHAVRPDVVLAADDPGRDRPEGLRRRRQLRPAADEHDHLRRDRLRAGAQLPGGAGQERERPLRLPSSQNDATALVHARIQPDLISDLSGVHTAPEPTAYPIAGYSYMITPTKLQDGFTTAKGAVLGQVHPLQRLRRPAEGGPARILAADAGAGAGRVRRGAADPGSSGAAAAVTVRQPDPARRRGTSGGPQGNTGPTVTGSNTRAAAPTSPPGPPELQQHRHSGTTGNRHHGIEVTPAESTSAHRRLQRPVERDPGRVPG